MSLLLLVLGSFGLGLFVSILDPFLNTWDELYHALVAKNMLVNPLKPVLYKTPILNYEIEVWTDNHIWLHKQPLFLWNIALSLKLFGVNELAVRVPSIIMHSIIPLFIFRIGNISLTRKIGFYAALLFSVAFYPLELVSGKYTADHNDIAFIFYITASIWSWFEYYRSGNRLWLIFIGIFSGFAVLVKWVLGMLVYMGWFLTLVSNFSQLFKINRYYHIIFSFCISIIIIVPWQVFILLKYPVESLVEYSGFSKHFSTVVEGHGGGILFHVNAIDVLYGKWMIIPILISLVLLYSNIRLNSYKIFILGTVIFVYTFFSIAETKMLSFCLIVSPFIFIGISLFFVKISSLVEKLYKSKIYLLVIEKSVFLLLCVYIFNFTMLKENHDIQVKEVNNYRKNKIIERSIINKLEIYLPNKNYIIFNTKYSQGGNISFMFYSDYIAYRFIPTKEECKIVLNRGYKIAILDFGDIPDYLRIEQSIIKIPINQ